MRKLLAFDDVILTPEFSLIKSRSPEFVDTSVDFLGMKLSLPVLPSNMDSVSGPSMAAAFSDYGAVGTLHRFMTIEENVDQFIEVFRFKRQPPIVSIGIGDKEMERAEALVAAGATHLLLDVAWAANMEVVKFYMQLVEKFTSHADIIVGNFATAQSVKDFTYHACTGVQAIKVGIGGGSMCQTRKVTGMGWPTLASLLDIAPLGIPMIADGGIRGQDDFCKSLAAGAKMVMCGGLFAGASESPGELYSEGDKYGVMSESSYRSGLGVQYDVTRNGKGMSRSDYIEYFMAGFKPTHKKYRGSASAESYKVQGKEASWRTPEGDSTLVEYTGPVKDTLQWLEAGLRSSMSYAGAATLEEYTPELCEITSAGAWEGTLHGGKK